MQKNIPQAIRLADRLKLFPDSTSIGSHSLSIAGCDLASLAAEFGTPLYIYDRLTLDALVADYQSALRDYPAPSGITYAGKAFLCKAIAEWTQKHNLLVDCTGEGEINIAIASGVPRENILVHGVNKSVEDLKTAINQTGTIVVDNLPELHHIHVILSDQRERHLPRTQAVSPRRALGPNGVPGRISPATRETLRSQPTLPQSDINFWLRLVPGVAVHTHHSHTQTGQHDSKFGMTREEILKAAQFCRENNLPLTGIHFHQGSNFRDPEPLLPAIDLALDLAMQIGFRGGWHFSPGGGWGTAYHEDELPDPSIESYVGGIAEALVEGCRSRGLELPHLHLEPGRSLIARAGVAIYRVGAVKRRGDKTWLLIDGGMADNPRFALYGARYSCLPVAGLDREVSRRVSIAGPYCESGDILIENLPMPDVEEGEWIAIPVAGAYQMSMASNYNGARRPAVLMLEEGKAKLIVRRETVDDLLKNQV